MFNPKELMVKAFIFCGIASIINLAWRTLAVMYQGHTRMIDTVVWLAFSVTAYHFIRAHWKINKK